MTELALTRIFSVTMYYHFAFLAISIALFGLSASGVYVFIARRALGRRSTAGLLATHALVYAAATILALAMLVRIHVGLNYSPANLGLMIAIYVLASLPFFTGGAVVSLAVSRLAARINHVYAADLIGAAFGCLLLIPLLNRLGAPGVVIGAAALAALAALLFAPAERRVRIGGIAAAIVLVPLSLHVTDLATLDIVVTKGHRGDRILFNKWNSFSRIAVYDREHGDWSLSATYQGPRPETRYMDIDSAASTPILGLPGGDLTRAAYLKYELTAFGYHLKDDAAAGGAAADGSTTQDGGAFRGFSALVIGPGGGRDLASALVFGAVRVDGVEINPIIARDVMGGRFREFSGSIYDRPRVRVFVDDGRSYVRRTRDRYDVIQASLVDTWAATAAGAYTLSENTLYTVEAFTDYFDHLTDQGVVSITRWLFDGLRLVSLAREACRRRGVELKDRIAVIGSGRVANFLFKRTPFTAEEIAKLRDRARALGFAVIYLPGPIDGADSLAAVDESVGGVKARDYRTLIEAADPAAFYASYRMDVTPTTDDRPFFFHTTKLEDQFDVAFGRSMLFGNGLSALLTLMGISAVLVVLFIVGPLALAARELPRGWLVWLCYFGTLGAGFMLIEVALLQRFVLLLGHPVYSLTITLFSLLLGTGIGSFLARRVPLPRLPFRIIAASIVVVGISVLAIYVLPATIARAMVLDRAARLALAAALILPAGIVMGQPLPAGVRLLSARHPELIPWAWGLNGALSVVGATVAVFIAMNWGFSATLACGAAVYLATAVTISLATR
jgi:hypothetical protein